MSSATPRQPAGDLLETWEDYYRQTSGDTILKDRSFFELEINALRDAVLEYAPARPFTIVELGSGTGLLATVLTDALREKAEADVRYIGVDFSEEAVARAQARDIPGAEFERMDFQSFLDANRQKIDMVVAQRSIMAVIDPAAQRRLLESIKAHLTPDGLAILSEGTVSGCASLNALRKRTGQAELDDIWHCLYLDEQVLCDTFEQVSVQDYASTYWLLTRVIYPFEREPKHNTPLHELAAHLPQTGDYGLVKLIIAR